MNSQGEIILSNEWIQGGSHSPLVSGISDEYSMSGWSNKKGEQNNYLIHVTPPGDSYTQAVRELSIKMDLATAGILYDKTVRE